MPAGHTAIPHPAALDRERVGEVQSRAQREKRSVRLGTAIHLSFIEPRRSICGGYDSSSCVDAHGGGVNPLRVALSWSGSPCNGLTEEALQDVRIDGYTPSTR